MSGWRSSGRTLRATAPPTVQVAGTARVGRRTKDLVKRLRPGEVAVIDHADLDRVAAEGLVEARVAAVVNASPSITGRYPNIGPLLVVAAGIPVVDAAGPDVMERIDDGAPVVIRGGEVWLGDARVASGHRLSIEEVRHQLEQAKASMSEELVRFASNTLEYLQQETHLITDSPDVPDIKVDLRGRHVLLVVRGHDYREDLEALRRGGYLTDMQPVLVGVDGGADALLELGERPDVIIGDFDSVSEDALRCGAELIVHGYPDGTAPGAARLDALGLEHLVFQAPGTSEDIAMLLAHERGADLIVAVGTHSSMTDFLDKGRAGMASTFLVRLRVGPILVDAKGVNRLYRARVRKRDLALLVASAVAAMVTLLAASDVGRLFVRSVWLWMRSSVG